jgi:hypothetical protein
MFSLLEEDRKSTMESTVEVEWRRRMENDGGEWRSRMENDEGEWKKNPHSKKIFYTVTLCALISLFFKKIRNYHQIKVK